MSPKRTTSIDGLVAKRIRTQRMMLGMSQSELGEKLGVSFQQVQKYEKGVNRIGAGRIFEIARVFNVPIQILFPELDLTAVKSADAVESQDNMLDALQTADGWRLCRAFLRIEDPDVRRKIIALVEDIAPE